jgi:hypothetical protein
MSPRPVRGVRNSGSSSCRRVGRLPDTLPEPVARLAALSYQSGKAGCFYEFADGRLFEVSIRRSGALPRCRVVAELDLRDLGTLRASLETFQKHLGAPA